MKRDLNTSPCIQKSMTPVFWANNSALPNPSCAKLLDFSAALYGQLSNFFLRVFFFGGGLWSEVAVCFLLNVLQVRVFTEKGRTPFQIKERQFGMKV